MKAIYYKIKEISIFKTTLKYIIILFFLSVYSCAKAQQFGDSLNSNDKRMVITKLKKLLKKHYVFKDKGIAMGSLLEEKLNKGVYDSVSSPEAFAKLLMNNLKEWSNDNHFLVYYARPLKPEDITPLKPAIPNVEILDNNIALVTNLPKLSIPKKEVSELMKKISDVDVIIFDFRSCSGSSREASNFFLSYLLEKQTHYAISTR